MTVSLDAAHFNELLALVEANNNQIGRPELIKLEKESKEVTNFKAGRIKLQDLSAAGTHWMAVDSLNKRIRGLLAYTSLGRWLERDTWTPKEALVILAGLDPVKSSIEWPHSNSSGATTASPIIREAFIFADWATTFFLPHTYAPGQPKSILLSMIEDSRELGFDEVTQELLSEAQQEQDWAVEKLDALRRTQVSFRREMLECISQRWYSSVHDTESRQSPQFFIQWAETLGFQIEWVSWARGENLLSKSSTSHGSISSSEGRHKGGTEKVWTEEKLAELATFRASHSVKKTVEHFGVTAQRIRFLLARYEKEKKPLPSAHSPFPMFRK